MFENVESHFKFHMVIHLDCKFCLYTLKTLFDKAFWDKVCNSCGKIIPDTLSRKMYWHKKIHSLDWACDECDLRLNRKWNFKRHLLEVHGLEFHEIDAQEETGRQEEQLTSVSAEKGPFHCSSCKKIFTCLADLETHLSEHSLQQEEHTCDICGKMYSRNYKLQQHIKLEHMKEEAMFPCTFCGKEFNRKDNLMRHERMIHGDK